MPSQAVPKIMYGSVPVAWTVIWSSEEQNRPWSVGKCLYAPGLSLLTPESPGVGKPLFGKTHPVRQRHAVMRCLCEICGRQLDRRAKISMSEERETEVLGLGYVPLVVEPLCCTHCALLATHHCPHLKRKVADGTIHIRQVFAFRPVAQLLNRSAIEEFCGPVLADWHAGKLITGHVKMALTKQLTRDLAWLEAQV